MPTNIEHSTVITWRDDQTPADNQVIYQLRTDYDFLGTFELELIAGRKLSPEFSTDKEGGCLVNETAAKTMGWSPDEAIGKQFSDGWSGKKTIVGVVRDFHMHSMHLSIEPLMIEIKDYFRFISVKVRPENLQETIAFLEESLEQHSPYPFEYQFLDDRFNQLYQADLRQGEVLSFFTILTMLIASSGLFGMAAFSAHQRIKEVGIRKVLGASIRDIIAIFAGKFIRMVFLGFLIAVPIAWYLMNRWLDDFAYRIPIRWWMLFLPGLFALIIAFLTISSQSFRAATSNPVKCLRDE